MRKLIYTLFFCCILSLGYQQTIFAQLEVNGAVTAEEMAELLVGQGVEISNIELNCPDGAFGTFNGVNSNLGIDEGIILTSGSIDNAVGPNDQGGASTSLGSPGDPDLDVIAIDATNDACVLEFDFVPFSDELTFNYVFGSEEYLEYVDSFNDAFAFFISGPNPTGGDYLVENIALIPGTATPVTINSVNDIDNSEFYVDNGDGLVVDPETTVQYDGFTVVLSAIVNVIPCETYRLKLAVADALDTALDSGVFLESGSLSTNFVDISASAVTLSSGDFNVGIEACVDGIVTFTTNVPQEEDFVVEFTLGGSAVEGEDYTIEGTTATIPAGEIQTQLPITILEDGVLDADTLDIIYTVDFGCSDTTDVFTQVASIPIFDIIPLTVSDDVTILPGFNTILNVEGGVPNIPGIDLQSGEYIWTPSLGLNDATSPTPTATPIETTTYTVTALVGDCEISTQVTVFVQACDPETDGQAGFITLNADILCAGDELVATANETVLNTVGGIPDVLGYALHNNPDGNIEAADFVAYDLNSTGTWVNDGSFPTNTTLYVSSIVADDANADGLPDLDDACISVSVGAPVVFLEPLVLEIDASCDFNTGEYTVTAMPMGGYPAFDPTSTYTVFGDFFGELVVGESITIIFPEGSATSYDFTAADILNCSDQQTDVFYCEKNVPIELLSFTGKAEKEGNLIQWATATEINNDYFTLERSIDGTNFEVIATVDGAGNSINTLRYEYLDNSAPNGISYYRLTQTDYNGQSNEEGTIAVMRNQAYSFGITNIAPVPASSNLNISFTVNDANQAVLAELVDVSGRIVISHTFMPNATGLNVVNLNIEQATDGMYFLRLTNGEQSVASKVVKN